MSSLGATMLSGLEELWAETAGDPRVSIAVIDGPVDLSHSCFAGADLTVVETLVPGRAGQDAAAEHGTHVASVIFGQHSSDVTGIAPSCRGLILPVFTTSKDGSMMPCSQIDLARAINRAVEFGANVINFSGGEFAASSEGHQLLESAVRLCSEEGVLIVAAAGNDGCRCLHVPAALPSVLAVGAMDAKGAPLGFSNWGEAYAEQGVLAPGTRILGAAPGGGTARMSGTSFAAPIVSGVAALLISLQLKREQTANTQSVRQAILGSAVGCDVKPASDCRRLLAGRLDISGAVNRLENGGEARMSDNTEAPERTGAQPQEATCPLPAEPVATETAESATLTTPAVVASSSALESGAAVAASGDAAQLVYALGTIGHDFGSEARRDSFSQAGLAEPDSAVQLGKFLADNTQHRTAVTFTLNLEATPIYAIMPAGPFAAATYDKVLSCYMAQFDHEAQVERVSIPGYTHGKTQLSNGKTVPYIFPETRGICPWSTGEFVGNLLGKDQDEERAVDIANFLDRVSYEIGNLGTSPRDRALNFAATNAFQVERVFESAYHKDLKLDAIAVEPSPICRPDSDCWDVKLTFFNPKQRLEQAREVYRFTIDVSDVIPVTLGKVRHWHVN